MYKGASALQVRRPTRVDGGTDASRVLSDACFLMRRTLNLKLRWNKSCPTTVASSSFSCCFLFFIMYIRPSTRQSCRHLLLLPERCVCVQSRERRTTTKKREKRKGGKGQKEKGLDAAFFFLCFNGVGQGGMFPCFIHRWSKLAGVLARLSLAQKHRLETLVEKGHRPFGHRGQWRMFLDEMRRHRGDGDTSFR